MSSETMEERVVEVEDNIDNIYKTLRNYGEELSKLKYSLMILMGKKCPLNNDDSDSDSDNDEYFIENPFE
jgi:hypothetical protein